MSGTEFLLVLLILSLCSCHGGHLGNTLAHALSGCLIMIFLLVTISTIWICASALDRMRIVWGLRTWRHTRTRMSARMSHSPVA